MEKVLLFKTDRSLTRELDFRKAPKRKLNQFLLVKVVNNQPVEQLIVHGFSDYRDLKDFILKGFNGEGFIKLSDSSFIMDKDKPSDKDWKKFKKSFKYVDVSNLNIAENYLHSVELLENAITDHSSSIKEIIKGCSTIDYRTKTGKLRRFNCKDKLIVSAKGCKFITNSSTYITHEIDKGGDVKELKQPDTYYSLGNVLGLYSGSFTPGTDTPMVIKLGKKKRSELIELYKKRTEARGKIKDLSIEALNSIV